MIGMLIEADQDQDGGDAAGARRIVEGAPERDQPEIHDEEDEERGEPRVPHPPGAPHRLAPDRAGDEAEKREGRAERRRALGGDVGERMPPDQRAERRDRHQRVAAHREDRRRHVHIHDAHAVALLVVGRRDEEREIKPEREEARRRPPKATAGGAPEKARKRVGLASSVRLGMASVPSPADRVGGNAARS